MHRVLRYGAGSNGRDLHLHHGRNHGRSHTHHRHHHDFLHDDPHRYHGCIRIQW